MDNVKYFKQDNYSFACFLHVLLPGQVTATRGGGGGEVGCLS